MNQDLSAYPISAAIRSMLVQAVASFSDVEGEPVDVLIAAVKADGRPIFISSMSLPEVCHCADAIKNTAQAVHAGMGKSATPGPRLVVDNKSPTA